MTRMVLDAEAFNALAGPVSDCGKEVLRILHAVANSDDANYRAAIAAHAG